MRPLITLALLCLFSVSSLQAQWGWGDKRIKGNGNLITQARDLDDFTGVKACCNLEVELTQGENYSVEVRADENLQEYVETRVFGSTLEIGFRDNTNLNPSTSIRVFITLPELTMIDASSSADIVTTSAFKGDRLELESSSGSSIEAEFMGNFVFADASSGGGVSVSGEAGEIEAEASSGAKVYGNKLAVERADVDVSSGARIEVNAKERIKADASSGGSVRYSGNPSSVDADTSSGGSIRKS